MSPLRLLGELDNHLVSPASAWAVARVELSTHFVWPCVASRILNTYPEVQPELHAILHGICKRRDRLKMPPAAEIRRIRSSYRQLRTWLNSEKPDTFLALGMWAAQTQHPGMGVDDLMEHLPWRDSWNVAKALQNPEQAAQEVVLRQFQQFVQLIEARTHEATPFELSMPNAFSY